MATQTLQQHSHNEKAAPLGRQIIAQARVELLLTLRRGESVLITLIVPVLLLIFITSLNMAGALRAEVTLAAANGLYLLFLLLGGGILPLSHLPPTLAAIAQILPPAALTQALQATMSNNAPFPLNSLVVLVIWTVAILLVAIKTFKWE